MRNKIEQKEAIIKLWFNMWLSRHDLGIDDIFDKNAIYIESWGPKHETREEIKHWFNEWNTRGQVVKWDIKQFFHKNNQSIVEWYFKNKINDGKEEEFDGLSLIQWSQDNKIKFLKEFGCNINNYNPYKNGESLRLKNEKSNWF